MVNQNQVSTRNHWNPQLPQNQRRTPEGMKAALLSKRAVTDRGCWEWTGALSKSGYGKVKWRPRDLRVHRVAAHLWLGFDLDDERLICHRCDNPKCFNPDHLFVGTDKDNQLDCASKGRHFGAKKTHCKRGHELSPENVYRTSRGHRSCRACHREDANASYRRRVCQ
jgi:HNH endonuclease